MTIKLPKQNPGQDFDNLNMLTDLLSKPKKSNPPPVGAGLVSEVRYILPNNPSQTANCDSKQASKQTSKQASKQTNKQTNKQTTKFKFAKPKV